MMNRRVDAAVRKQQIIEAAAAVFAQKGFSEASMDDIVQASGLSKGGLYWHFKSKEEIVTAVLDEFFAAELAEVQQILTAPTSAAEKILRLWQQMIADAVAEMSTCQSIWLEMYAMAGRQQAFRERIWLYLQQFIDLLAALIQLGIADGEFRAVVAQDAAMAGIAQFEGLILLWATDPERVDLPVLAETAVQIWLNGLSS